MNPIAYRVMPKEPLWFLIVGEMQYYMDAKHPQRVWELNIYSTAKSRTTAAKKMKRHLSDAIFIEWDTTIEQLLKEGKMVFPIASEKILQTDKIDIWRQLNRAHG